MEFADSVAHEWKYDGQFENLPVEHPFGTDCGGAEAFPQSQKRR